jgi:hypothetical protein
MWLGYDGLYAARAVLVFWGAAMVVTFGLLLYRFTWLNDLWKLAALMVVALATAEVAGNYITPDVIVAAWLFAYFAVAVHPELMKRRRLQVLAGVLGGVAYLAKAYAFPFVLIHVPLTLVIRGWGEWKGNTTAETAAEAAPTAAPTALKRVVMVWFVTMAGFALVAGPWVGVLSWRYGYFTFSTSGSRNHAIMGPHKANRTLPTYLVPEGPYLIPWENPETIAYRFWSPLESRKFFMHQVGVVAKNGKAMLGTFWNLDVAHLAAAGLVLWPVGLLMLRRGQRWQGLWLMMTMALYCCGFLLVWYSDRYIVGIVIPLMLMLWMKALLENGGQAKPVWMGAPLFPGGRFFSGGAGILACHARTFLSGHNPRAVDAGGQECPPAADRNVCPTKTCGLPGLLGTPRWRLIGAGVVLASFAAGGASNVYALSKVHRPNLYRQVGEEIRRLGLPGAMASEVNTKSYFLAYHAQRKLVFIKPGDTVEVIEQKLRECGVGMVVVWKAGKDGAEPDRSGVRELVGRPGWQCVYSRGREGLEIYAPAGGEMGKLHERD